MNDSFRSDTAQYSGNHIDNLPSSRYTLFMPSAPESTRHALLDAAGELAQTRGYNAFSFRDLSERIGVTTASIHYHFPSKADLGRELVIRYRDGCNTTRASRRILECILQS